MWRGRDVRPHAACFFSSISACAAPIFDVLFSACCALCAGVCAVDNGHQQPELRKRDPFVVDAPRRGPRACRQQVSRGCLGPEGCCARGTTPSFAMNCKSVGLHSRYLPCIHPLWLPPSRTPARACLRSFRQPYPRACHWRPASVALQLRQCLRLLGRVLPSLGSAGSLIGAFWLQIHAAASTSARSKRI